MLEIRLIAVFVLCTAFIAVCGFAAARSADNVRKSPHIFIMLPAGENASDVEFLVRSCVYGTVERYPEAVVMLCANGEEKETVYIFERLMENRCKYYIINRADWEKNVCKIINSML